MEVAEGKQMQTYLKLAGIAAVSSQLMVISARAQEAQGADDIRMLRQKIEELERKVQALESGKKPTPEPSPKVEELEQKVKILERNRELDDEAAETKAKDAPKITIGSEGFGFKSADGNFGVQLKGVLQVDSRTFFNDAGIMGNDGLLLRRARPILQGTLYKDFSFLFVPDFGGTGGAQIFDAYLNYSYNPALQLRAGKFKSPVGLEQLQSDSDLLFNERALPTALVPNRDIGFQVYGEILGATISYAAGIFNGVGDARNSNNADFDDEKAYEGRLFFEPFKKTSLTGLQGLGFGVGGSYEDQQRNATGLPATTGSAGGAVAGYATDGQQQFFAYAPGSNAVVVADGEHWRLSPQGYYSYGPFWLLGEYVISNQKVVRTVTAPLTSARLEHTGWQISAGYVLTGEDYNYKGGVIPRRPFDPRQGSWGAWQLVARYAELDIDNAAYPLFSSPGASASSVQSWSAGLNWWLNRNLRVLSSFSHTDFQGGGGAGATAPAIVTRKDENVFFTRLQLAF